MIMRSATHRWHNFVLAVFMSDIGFNLQRMLSPMCEQHHSATSAFLLKQRCLSGLILRNGNIFKRFSEMENFQIPHFSNTAPLPSSLLPPTPQPSLSPVLFNCDTEGLCIDDHPATSPLATSPALPLLPMPADCCCCCHPREGVQRHTRPCTLRGYWPPLLQPLPPLSPIPVLATLAPAVATAVAEAM